MNQWDGISVFSIGFSFCRVTSFGIVFVQLDDSEFKTKSRFVFEVQLFSRASLNLLDGAIF